MRLTLIHENGDEERIYTAEIKEIYLGDKCLWIRPRCKIDEN